MLLASKIILLVVILQGSTQADKRLKRNNNNAEQMISTMVRSAVTKLSKFKKFTVLKKEAFNFKIKTTVNKVEDLSNFQIKNITYHDKKSLLDIALSLPKVSIKGEYSWNVYRDNKEGNYTIEINGLSISATFRVAVNQNRSKLVGLTDIDIDVKGLKVRLGDGSTKHWSDEVDENVSAHIQDKLEEFQSELNSRVQDIIDKQVKNRPIIFTREALMGDDKFTELSDYIKKAFEDIEHRVVDLTKENLKFQFKAKLNKIEGLSKYSTTWNKTERSIRITMPKIVIKGEYEYALEGKILNILPINGKRNYDVSIKKLSLSILKVPKKGKSSTSSEARPGVSIAFESLKVSVKDNVNNGSMEKSFHFQASSSDFPYPSEFGIDTVKFTKFISKYVKFI